MRETAMVLECPGQGPEQTKIIDAVGTLAILQVAIGPQEACSATMFFGYFRFFIFSCAKEAHQPIQKRGQNSAAIRKLSCMLGELPSALRAPSGSRSVSRMNDHSEP